MRRSLALITLAPTLLLTLAAGDARARVDWRAPGHYRLRVGHTGDVPGVPQGRNLVATHRLRIEPTVELHAVTLVMQLDVLTGQIAGDTTSLGDRLGERRHGDPTRSTDGWTTVEPRLFAVYVDLDWMSAQLGQLAAHRGLGLVDNDGSERCAPDGLERFGDRVNGDIVDRAAVQVRPGWRALNAALRGLAVGGGVDWIYQDDQASTLDDDGAWRAFGTLDLAVDGFEAGLRGLYRDQTDRQDRTRAGWLVDGWVRGALPLHAWRATAHLAGDVAVTEDGAIGVLSQAALAFKRVSIGVDSGFASGGDAVFTFDPDVRVGLVLFDAIERQRSMAAAEADPTALAPDPRPTDGAVQDAVFAHPLLTWTLPRWRFTAGSLLAWRADGQWLGLEHDVGVHHRFALGAVGLQAGVATPGTAITPGDGRRPPVARVVGRLDLHW